MTNSTNLEKVCVVDELRDEMTQAARTIKFGIKWIPLDFRLF